MVFPLSLTSLMYAGSLVLKSMLIMSSWKEYRNQCEGMTIDYVKIGPQNILNWVFSTTSSILAWRNYVVVSIFTIYFNRLYLYYFSIVIGVVCIFFFKIKKLICFMGNNLMGFTCSSYFWCLTAP